VIVAGAKETVGSVRFLFNSVDFGALISECEAQQIRLVSPVDMKMASLMLGIDQNSSTFPLVYNLWSPFYKQSKPEVSIFEHTYEKQNKQKSSQNHHT
jgi:hypothetical protein